MKKVIFLLFIVSFLSACGAAFAPPIPDNLNFPEQSKVGIYIDVNDFPTHTHIGTTVFNNAVTEYEFEWNMEETIRSIFTDKIKSKTSFEIVDLKTINLPKPINEGINIVDIKAKEWSYVEENTDLKNALLAENIHAVIRIVEQPTLALLNCSNLGCAELYSQGYGLFSRSFLMFERYYASASFVFDIEILEPPVDLARSVEFADLRGFEVKHTELSNYDVEDRKNITEQEMEAVKKIVVAYIEKLADITAENLSK